MLAVKYTKHFLKNIKIIFNDIDERYVHLSC